MKPQGVMLLALVVLSTLLAGASAQDIPTSEQQSLHASLPKTSSSLARRLGRKLLETTTGIYRGWGVDVVPGRAQAWWRDAPLVNADGHYNGWGSDFVPAWVAQG